MPANSIITVRKGTASQWNSTNPVLASGEPGYDLTNNILKIGDGVSNWNNLKNVASISGLITASSGNFNSLSVSGISVSVSGHTHSSSDITDLGSLATKNSIKISDIISDNLGGNYSDGGSADGFLAQIEGNGLSDALDSLGGVPDNLVNCSSLSYQDQGGNTVTPQLSSVLPDFDLFRYRSLFSPIPWAPNQDQYIYRCYTYNGRLYQKKSSDSNSGSVFNSGLYTLLGSAETINLSQVSGVGSLASLNSLGNISSSGAIGSSSGLLVVTTSNGTLTTSSGIDSSLISNFNSSVSGLLPVKNIIAGTGVSITSSSGIYTINSSSGSSSSSSSIDAGEYPLISISSQPSGISVAESSIATFSVTATASYPSGTISYQWQNSSDNTNWSNIISANSSTLTLTSVTSSDNGKYYRCNLQSLLSNINSNSAQLTVLSGFVATSVILSSNSNYTVPNGAKVVKIWSIGAGGSFTNYCDGGGAANGNPGVVSYRHGFISNTNVVINGVIGQPVASACDLSTQGGSSTLSNLSTVINPSISSLVGGGGGIELGRLADRSSSNGLSTYTLWSNYSTRRDYLGINAVINAAGGNSSTHTYGRGSNGGNGFSGAIVMQFLPATDLVLPFTGNGSFTIPTGYSSVKIWAVGAGGIGNIYCDGGPTTSGGAGGIAHKTWSVSAGQVITYSAAAQLYSPSHTWCGSPTNGSSSTATLNGVTITGGGGLGNGTNGSGTGGDGSGVAGNDVSSIYDAYASYAATRNLVATPYRGLLPYGSVGDQDGNTGGIVLVKFMV